MKAHIAKLPPPTALAWNVPAGGLETVCARAAVRFRRVEPRELGQTVGELCGLPGAPKRHGEGAADDMPALVLWGLEGDELDAFLGLLREARVSIPLKAVVTDTNKAWPFGALLKELAAERREMEQGQK